MNHFESLVFNFAETYKSDLQTVWNYLVKNEQWLCIPPISRATVSAFLGPWTSDTRPKVTVFNEGKKCGESASLLNSFV